MHMSPSAKASRVGLPAKSSVLSSKLVAGWKHRVLTSGHILGNKTFNRFFEKLSISFLSNVTCWVAIFFSRHPVASCDSEIAVFGLIWFGLTNDRPKLILLLSYTFGSVTFLRHNSQFLAVDICTGFHRCNTFQLWHCVILQHNFTSSFHQSILRHCTGMFSVWLNWCAKYTGYHMRINLQESDGCIKKNWSKATGRCQTKYNQMTLACIGGFCLL